MKIIYNQIFLEHDTRMNPENKNRLLFMQDVKGDKILNGEPYLELIHTRKYIEKVKEYSEKEKNLDNDTVTCKKSYEVAVNAVGATIMASQSNDFAIVRPPGHHAHRDRSSGFCIFNNIAIATMKLVNEGKKVLIFDFDSHMGDGTEEIFYKTDKVFYFSIHQYPAFPGKGWANEIGKGKGKGYTLNIPLPPKSSDDLFIKSIKKVLPILKKFKPDVVAISAGFDGHKDDLLLDLNLTYNSYYQVGEIIRKNFKNFFATLEGGYNIKFLPPCIINFIDAINAKKQRYKEIPTKSSKEVIKEYEKRMRILDKSIGKYWK